MWESLFSLQWVNHCSSSLREALSCEFRSGVPLGGPLCWWPCSHRWITQGMCQEALDLERSNRERTESKCRKDEEHDLWYGTWPLAEYRQVYMCRLAATASSAMAASTGCTRNAVGSSASQRTLITDVHSARELHAPWMADHRGKQARPDKLEVVASFGYLGDMLSAAGGCELSTTMCENRLEEVQGAATSSLFLPPLFQDMWPHVQLSCMEHNAPCQWDVAVDKAKPPTSAVKWQGNDQTDLQCQAARHCHHQIQWATCAALH